MAFGVILAVVGVLLFIKMGTQGTSKVKMLGVELQLGGSALVVFVIGVFLFLVPILFEDRIPQGRVEPESQDVYVIAYFHSEIRLEHGVFPSMEACDSVILALNLQDQYSAVAKLIQDSTTVWAISYQDPGEAEQWQFFLDRTPADLVLALVEGKDKRIVRTRCLRMTFAQARQRVAK